MLSRWFLAVLLAAMVSVQAHADTPAAKDPLNYPLRQYALVLAVAILGGVASWIAKVRSGRVHAWHLMSLIGELCTSALAGLLCFWLCEWQGFSPLLTASLVGIAGHMGTRALTLAEKVAERRWGITAPTPLDETHR
mgnify:FL=1